MLFAVWNATTTVKFRVALGELASYETSVYCHLATQLYIPKVMILMQIMFLVYSARKFARYLPTKLRVQHTSHP
jgi:hypothetical protein